MNQNSQEQVLRENIKLLRKTFHLPEETFFQSLKRRLDAFVSNGATLFAKFYQQKEGSENSDRIIDEKSLVEEREKPHIKYSFQNFTQNVNEPLAQDVEVRDKGLNHVNKQFDNFSQDPQNSKVSEQQQSFEHRFKKGHKRLKRELSQSSIQKSSQKPLKNISREESKFYESINFWIFAQMQKNLVEAKKKSLQKSTEESNSKYSDYLEYALKVGSISTLNNEPKSDVSTDFSKSDIAARAERRLLRKKVFFEDETHQLYDLGKVYETLQSERLRRQEERRQIETKKREQEKMQIQRYELARKLQAQKREYELQRQRELQIQLEAKKLAEQKLLQEQKQKEEADKQKETEIRSSLDLGQKDEGANANYAENEIKAAVAQSKEQLPLMEEPPRKKSSEEKKSEKLLGTPVKSPQPEEQQQQTPLNLDKSKMNNPFFIAPTKTLGLQDLINNQRSNEKLPFFNKTSITSPPRANIFNNNQQVPVNNLFMGQGNMQQGPIATPLMPTSTVPLQQTQPAGSFASFMSSPLSNTPNSNNMSYGNPQQSFYTNPMGNFANNNINAAPMMSFNSSGSGSGNASSGGMGGIGSMNQFPNLPQPQRQFDTKNLFMNTTQQTTSLFGSSLGNASASSNPRATTGRKGKGGQIRIS